MSEPILTIHNRHSAVAGVPPAFSNEAGQFYLGYFENRHGQQRLFAFDRVTREAVLRGEDADWGRAHGRALLRLLVFP